MGEEAGIYHLIEENMADRPLTDLKESFTTIATDINDLPGNQPARKSL